MRKTNTKVSKSSQTPHQNPKKPTTIDRLTSTIKSISKQRKKHETSNNFSISKNTMNPTKNNPYLKQLMSNPQNKQHKEQSKIVKKLRRRANIGSHHHEHNLNSSKNIREIQIQQGIESKKMLTKIKSQQNLFGIHNSQHINFKNKDYNSEQFEIKERNNGKKLRDMKPWINTNIIHVNKNHYDSQYINQQQPNQQSIKKEQLKTINNNGNGNETSIVIQNSHKKQKSQQNVINLVQSNNGIKYKYNHMQMISTELSLQQNNAKTHKYINTEIQTQYNTKKANNSLQFINNINELKIFPTYRFEDNKQVIEMREQISRLNQQLFTLNKKYEQLEGQLRYSKEAVKKLEQQLNITKEREKRREQEQKQRQIQKKKQTQITTNEYKNNSTVIYSNSSLGYVNNNSNTNIHSATNIDYDTNHLINYNQTTKYTDLNTNNPQMMNNNSIIKINAATTLPSYYNNNMTNSASSISTSSNTNTNTLNPNNQTEIKTVVIRSNSPNVIRLGKERLFCTKGCTLICKCLCENKDEKAV